MVLDHGRQVYYGPASEARAYFEDLGYKPMPRQTTADYLTGCTDPHERQYAPGRSSLDVPSAPDGLQHAFRTSSTYANIQQLLEGYKTHQEVEKADQEAFQAAVLADKKKGVSKKSPHTLGFRGQVWALTRRQFQMRLQDKFQLVTSFAMSVVLAFVIGGAYFNLPSTAAGGFTRGSVIFFSVMMLTFDAFGEIPLMMIGRSIFWKQVRRSPTPMLLIS